MLWVLNLSDGHSSLSRHYGEIRPELRYNKKRGRRAASAPLAGSLAESLKQGEIPKGTHGETMATIEFVFDLVQDSVFTRTMGGTINFWNRSAEAIYGWRKEEAIGRVSHNLLQTIFPKPLEEIESELVRNGVWKGRLVHKTRDGRQVVVESRWALPRDGQSEALVEINTPSSDEDLSTKQSTDGVKPAVSLTEQTTTPLQQQEYLIDLIKDCVITRATDGTIKFWNQGAENLYGWRKEEAIGRVSHDILRTQFSTPLEAINSELVRNRRWEGKLVHTTRDGRQVVVKSQWSVEHDRSSAALMEIDTPSNDRESDSNIIVRPQARTRKQPHSQKLSRETWRSLY